MKIISDIRLYKSTELNDHTDIGKKEINIATNLQEHKGKKRFNKFLIFSSYLYNNIAVLLHRIWKEDVRI